MRCLSSLSLLFILVLLPFGLKAQAQQRTKQEPPAEIKKAATNLEKSLIENDNATIARNYELLAQEFIDKDDLPKAEESLIKAFETYASANEVSGKARVLRGIAQVQEAQNKLQAALQNYKKAMTEAGSDKTAKTLNSNDYNRLKNPNNFKVQNDYLEANIQLLQKSRKKREIAETYKQQAALSLRNADSITAIEKYTLAIDYAENPRKAIKIYGEIAKLHVAGKRFEEALPVLETLLDKARKIKDKPTEMMFLRYLATVYFALENPESGVEALRESYNIAAAIGNTFEARESLKLLIDHYAAVGNERASLDLYGEFLQNLDRIILSDSSLTDAKTFRVTEERIRRLESEKVFRDELINRKNTFNYFLIGSMALLLLFFGSIVKALYSIKTKNKEIALQSLRREMNPHFLFNSLNSVNQFIAQNNELEANKYLTSYSNLMRNTMENSNKDFVTLGNEIENLTKYLELEHLRFKDKFDFEIKVDEKLDPETIWIPNMIIQPHLENAIWHGLRYKEGKGLLKMEFSLSGKLIIITIDDDGIGPTRSSELKTHNQKAHQSRGLTNTRERMTLLNDLYKTRMDFTITEKEAPETGTIIQITFPIINR